MFSTDINVKKNFKPRLNTMLELYVSPTNVKIIPFHLLFHTLHYISEVTIVVSKWLWNECVSHLFLECLWQDSNFISMKERLRTLNHLEFTSFYLFALWNHRGIFQFKCILWSIIFNRLTFNRKGHTIPLHVCYFIYLLYFYT